jgi:hypothetical protein
MPTAKFTHDPGTPEYTASNWLITINNAFREIDDAINAAPNEAAFIERLKDRVLRDYEQNREEMGWTTRTRDVAARALEIVLQTRQ